MYEHAVKATEKLKAKEKEKLLQFRRNKKEKTQDREKRQPNRRRTQRRTGQGPWKELKCLQRISRRKFELVSANY